jgi:hypothetical protein
VKVTCRHGHKLHAVRGQVPAHDTDGHKLPAGPWKPLTANQEKSVQMRHRARNARQKISQRTECRGA